LGKVAQLYSHPPIPRLGSSQPLEKAVQAGQSDGCGTLLVVEEPAALGKLDELMYVIDDGDVDYVSGRSCGSWNGH